MSSQQFTIIYTQTFKTTFIGYQGFDCLTVQHSTESSQLYARHVPGNKYEVNLV